jgi:hypothetical protein
MSQERSETLSSPTFGTDGIGDFRASHGGPFYEMQRRLRLLRDDALDVEKRAIIFVMLAWAMPLLLAIAEGNAFGPAERGPYLLDGGAWARFFVAIALFVLSERAVEEGLREKLAQFTRAPLIEPSSHQPAASAVATALRRQNDGIAELVCLALALLVAFGSYLRFSGSEASNWAIQFQGSAFSFTWAGLWALVVSGPIFSFLLFRGLWRHLVWSLLLRRIAALELRLVVNHPDGKGGLAFVAEYPGAYAMFILGVSCAIAVGLGRTVFEDGISPQAIGGVLIVWLVVVLALFAFSLQAFSVPLAHLKQRALSEYGAQATRYSRRMERKLLGRNVFPGADTTGGDPDGVEISDPTEHFAAATKLSTILASRSALLPLVGAALIPFVAVGATRLPLVEILSLLKKLILL